MGLDETLDSGASVIAQAFADAGITSEQFTAGTYEPSEAVETPEVVETVEVERPRNPDGTFAARESAVEDEIALLKRQLAEKDSLIGRQSNEVGELRRQFEEFQQQQVQPVQQFDADQLDAWLDQNVAYLPQIAEQARQAGHSDVFKAALAKWRDYDDFGPVEYLATVKTNEATARLEAQLAQVAQPLAEQRRDQMLAHVVGEVQQKYSDLPQVLTKVGENPDLAPAFLLQGIQSDDPRVQREALEAVYRWVKQEEALPLRETVQQAAAEVVQAERQEKILATVATGATAPVVDETPRTPQDELIQFWQGSWGNGWGK